MTVYTGVPLGADAPTTSVAVSSSVKEERNVSSSHGCLVRVLLLLLAWIATASVILFLISGMTFDSDEITLTMPSVRNSEIATLHARDKVHHLTDSTLDTFLDENPTVFVNFYAPWCPYSQKLAPTWKEFAASSESAVVVADCDCTKFPQTCRHKGIVAYPTLRFFESGNQVHDYKRERTVEALSAFVDHALSESNVGLRGAIEGMDASDESEEYSIDDDDDAYADFDDTIDSWKEESTDDVSDLW